MVDPETVRRRLRKLDETVRRLRDLSRMPLEEFEADPLGLAAAERLLQVGIQAVLDVGAHLLSDRGLLDWDEYREIPERLAQAGVLSQELAQRLAKAAGQRNILVHMYLDVDPAEIHATLRNDLDAFEAFAEQVLGELEREE